MATELTEQLTRLGHKAELLVTRYESLQSDVRRLRDEVVELKSELAAANATIEKLKVDNEYLRVSSALAPDTESAIKTGRRGYEWLALRPHHRLLHAGSGSDQHAAICPRAEQRDVF